MNSPTAAGQFASLIHGPYLEPFCSGCHSSQAPANSQRQPYHGDPNIDVAYDAAKTKINLDTPANSQIVTKLRLENHNCWSGNCAADAQDIEDAITAFANGITPTQVDPNLVFSKALKLTDGTIASGGNRYEDAQIALWEFKTGSGLVAYDTSGVDPAIDLNLSQEVTWYGGWGITMNGGIARGTTTASSKVHDIFQESGEFSIEAWVIPANVTQEMARIVSYSAGEQARNFTLQQTLYNYDFLLRTNAEDANGDSATTLNGDPQLSTPDALEALQATLQHVVATYDPVNGRRIYVNGVLSTDVDPVPGGTFSSWQDNMAFILGNEASSDGLWEGTLRLVAIHRRALDESQINQNFDAGVGESLLGEQGRGLAQVRQAALRHPARGEHQSARPQRPDVVLSTAQQDARGVDRGPGPELADAHVDAASYDKMYAASINDPEAFWGEHGKRIDWIKLALQDPNAELHVGWDGKKKRYDRSHRVALVSGDYVVVIRLSGNQKAQFVTAYVADSSRTLAKIKGSPKWGPSK